MGKRLIQETNLNGIKIRVVRDSEWQEFVVSVAIGGVHDSASDYHTDSKDDAISTAGVMLLEAMKEFA